jgi:hypothetical protein
MLNTIIKAKIDVIYATHVLMNKIVEVLESINKSLVQEGNIENKLQEFLLLSFLVEKAVARVC